MGSIVGAALRDLARALDARGLDWYLFGAQAAIVYGSTRVTEDIDVTVHLGECAPRVLVAALVEAGFQLRVRDVDAFVERTRVLPFVRVPTSMPVDVVLAGPGLEELFLARVQRHRREGRMIPVASPEDLIVMKVLASRPHDHDDVRSILRALGTKLDVASIEETLRLVERALDQSDLLPIFTRLREEARGASAARTRRARPPAPKPRKRRP